MLAENGLLASTEGLAALAVRVAARLLVLMKLGKKEDLGEVGEAGVSLGDPLGDRPVNPLVGRAIWVGREDEPGRDMLDLVDDTVDVEEVWLRTPVEVPLSRRRAVPTADEVD